MAGHSHAKTVKRVKEAGDKKRSLAFSKIARLISVAVKEAGPNPETNSKLRLAIETAREANMPKDNIDRAIRKGTGEDISAENLQEVTFEAFGPNGIGIIIEGITDNSNRALGDIKQILHQHNAKLVSEGAVRWMFDRKTNKDGILEWIPKEITVELNEADLLAYEKLLEDLNENDAVQNIYSNLKEVNG